MAGGGWLGMGGWGWVGWDGLAFCVSDAVAASGADDDLCVYVDAGWYYYVYFAAVYGRSAG